MTGGDPHRGQAALKDYGCATCHTIPGVAEARGLVGPPLTGFANRVYVGGVAVNSVENLIAWIRRPAIAEPAHRHAGGRAAAGRGPRYRRLSLHDPIR